MSVLAAVITVSDKGSRGERVDTSGPAVAEKLREAGFEVSYQSIIPDEQPQIEAELIKCADQLGMNLIVTTGSRNAKDAFRNTVEVRRGAIKGGDRTFGYPSLVDVSILAKGDAHLEAAYASLFTAKYASIIVLSEMDYAKALPLYGLRQNLFTDPQKPMRVTPGIYPLNGADENAICATTVDFALTYFVVSGELERSGVPVNLLISDAGGYSVLTSWAAGKFSANTIAKLMGGTVDDIDPNGMVVAVHSLALDNLKDEDGRFNVRRYFGLA